MRAKDSASPWREESPRAKPLRHEPVKSAGSWWTVKSDAAFTAAAREQETRLKATHGVMLFKDGGQ